MPAGGKTEAFHGVAQELRPAGIRRSDLAQDPWREVGVEGRGRPIQPVVLTAARLRDAYGDRGAALARRPHHLLIGDRCDLDLDVHAVEEGTGDPPLIGAHGPGRTGAGGVSTEPTGAWIHGGEELEARR